MQPFDAARAPGDLAPSEHPVREHRLGFAFDLNLAQVLYLKQLLDLFVGIGSNLDCARRGGLLHPRGQIDRVANREIFHVQVVTDVAGHHQTGIQSDPHLKIRHAVFRAQFLAILIDLLENIERCIDRTRGIVFVGDRRAEESQHAVAQELRDRAFVAIDRFAHPAVRARNDLAPIFRVEFFGECGGSDNVGKEHRNLFALADDFAAGTRRVEFRLEFLGNVLLEIGA